MGEPGDTNLENLEFFNRLSATLRIELSEPTEAITPALENQKATPTAAIVSLALEPQIWVEASGEFRDLTGEELDRVVFEESEITLRGLGPAITLPAPDGARFSVRDLVAAVAECERKTRADSEWFGGIDVHHIFFEGITWDGEAWEIFWGS